MRLRQLQAVLEQIAPGRVVTWDLTRGCPASIPISPSVPSLPITDARTIRNLSILAQHVWPSWAARSVPGQRDRVLDWIDSERPTHAVVVHPHSTEFVAALQACGISVFIDMSDVERDKTRQLVRLTPMGPAKLEQLVRLCVIRRWERLYFHLAAEVWAASDADAARQRFLGGGRVRARAVPNALDLSHYPWETGPAVCDDSARDIVFPANFDYQPNVVGAKVFRDRAFPAVRSRIPDARFVLVGRDRSGSARALADSPQIVVTGEVPDTRPYLRRAGIVVVPLFHGSGTRFKILEALALGVPVVTTELGCAGLNVHDGQHLMIRDITQFADVVTDALTGQLDREALSYAGRQLVEAEYTWTAVSELVRDSLGLATP